MADDPSIHDLLAPNLQAAIDRKLNIGEVPLLTLSGANGEGLVVTDHRVAILREQMPIAGHAEVDCFDYPYEQIRDVRVDGAVGGGHLVLELIVPPLDEKQVTLFFPSYDLSRFDTAAARIRMIAQHASSIPVPGAPTISDTALLGATCLACSIPLPDKDWVFCPRCGTPRGTVCGFCSRVVPEGALYCPYCGVSKDLARSPNCAKCGHAVLASYSYCPQCGESQGARCGRCHGRILNDWSRCATCGLTLGALALGTTPSEDEYTLPTTANNQPESAEEHNSTGMSLYNREDIDGAIRHFEAALDLDPENALYHCNIGVALAELGKDDLALDHYNAAVGIAPNDPTAYLNLGYFYSEREQAERARQYWEKAIEVAPGSPEADESRQNLAHSDEV